MKNRIIVIIILLIIVFLAGFVPQYIKVNRLENDLSVARQENALAQLRDLAGLAFVQASQKNYARAYWLRERNVTVASCPLCRDEETAIAEYPLTDCLSPRSRPHDSSYLVLTGSKDPFDLQVIRSKPVGR